MLNLCTILELSTKQKRAISSFGVLTAEHWDKRIKTLRLPIRSSLKALQKNCCVYCGCPTTEDEDVEHIAHKSLYPQFVFTPKNLAYSCKTCNQTYKNSADVISTADPIYENCKFTIVHPYLDDVDHFFDTSKILIAIRNGLSEEEISKAKYTQKLLHWRDPAVRDRRAYAAAAQAYCRQNNTSLSQISLENTLTYKPGEF